MTQPSALLRALNPSSGGESWQLVQIVVTIHTVSAHHGCGSISARPAGSIFVTAVEQPRETAFSVLTVALRTLRRITNATATLTTDREGNSAWS